MKNDKDIYKTMYLKLMNATETAISQLIQAQRECEEMYLNLSEADTDESSNGESEGMD